MDNYDFGYPRECLHFADLSMNILVEKDGCFS